jgi:hypothetical protein
VLGARLPAREALAAAHGTIVAAGDYEIFVMCAQDGLKIGLTVSSRHWQASARGYNTSRP